MVKVGWGQVTVGRFQGQRDDGQPEFRDILYWCAEMLYSLFAKRIPHCLAGGTYENVLDLDNHVSCSLNKGIAGMHNLDQPVMKSP